MANWQLLTAACTTGRAGRAPRCCEIPARGGDSRRRRLRCQQRSVRIPRAGERLHPTVCVEPQRPVPFCFPWQECWSWRLQWRRASSARARHPLCCATWWDRRRQHGVAGRRHSTAADNLEQLSSRRPQVLGIPRSYILPHSLHEWQLLFHLLFLPQHFKRCYLLRVSLRSSICINSSKLGPLLLNEWYEKDRSSILCLYPAAKLSPQSIEYVQDSVCLGVFRQGVLKSSDFHANNRLWGFVLCKKIPISLWSSSSFHHNIKNYRFNTIQQFWININFVW